MKLRLQRVSYDIEWKNIMITFSHLILCKRIIPWCLFTWQNSRHFTCCCFTPKLYLQQSLFFFNIYVICSEQSISVLAAKTRRAAVWFVVNGGLTAVLTGVLSVSHHVYMTLPLKLSYFHHKLQMVILFTQIHIPLSLLRPQKQWQMSFFFF